jgi:hypothetical protein
MKRIQLVLAALAMVVATLAAFAGPVMAQTTYNYTQDWGNQQGGVFSDDYASFYDNDYDDWYYYDPDDDWYYYDPDWYFYDDGSGGYPEVVWYTGDGVVYDF